MRAGAVAGVEHLAHPIAVARLIMDRTPHVLLVAEGAEKFAKAQGIPLVPNEYFITPERREKYQKWRSRQTSQPEPHLGPHLGTHFGTTGAVALDARGNLAAGTTTGGTSWKLPGRVGTRRFSAPAPMPATIWAAPCLRVESGNTSSVTR